MKKKARTAFSRAQTQTLEAQFRKQVTCTSTLILSMSSQLANFMCPSISHNLQRKHSNYIWRKQRFDMAHCFAIISDVNGF